MVKYVFAVDTYMQKAKKNFSDARNTRNRNLNRLNDELQGVQRIMMQNIDDVLQRGENLSGNTIYRCALDPLMTKVPNIYKPVN